MKKKNVGADACALVGYTATGVAVFDRMDSHVHTEDGILRALLVVALSKVVPGTGAVTKAVINFGFVIGETSCVEVDPEVDDIFYERRGNRAGLTPMVRNRRKEPCRCLTVVLIRYGSCFKLLTAYIGNGSPKEPWDPSISSEDELKESQEFWRTHALVADDADRTVPRGTKKNDWLTAFTMKIPVKLQ